MNRASIAALAALGLAMAATQTTHAQGAPAPGNKDANAAADAALAEGRRYYDLQDFDKAIAKFKEAYSLREDTAALFNIAQSYRLKKDCASALSFYKTFKRKFPTDKAIEKVDKFITEMDTCAKTQAAQPAITTNPTTNPTTDSTSTTTTTTTVTPPQTTTTIVNPPPQPVDSGGGGGMRIASYGLFGVGAAGIVVGAIFASKASSKADQAEGGKAVNGVAPIWDPSIEKDGKRNKNIAIAGFAVGGAAIVGGAVLFVLSGKKSTESSSMTFVPTTEGGSFVYAGRF